MMTSLTRRLALSASLLALGGEMGIAEQVAEPVGVAHVAAKDGVDRVAL